MQKMTLGRFPHLFNVNVSTYAFSGSTLKKGTMLRANKAGTIDRIVCSVNSVTGSGATYDGRIETTTVNALPSGTLFSAGASGSITPTVGGVQTITLSTPVTVAEGDWFCLVLEPSSGVDGSNYVTFNMSCDWRYLGNGADCVIRTCNYNGTVWSYTYGLLNLAVQYDDDSIVEYTGVVTESTAPTIGNGGVIAVKWTQPFSVDLVGAYSMVGSTGGAREWNLNLYNSSDTLLSSENYSMGGGDYNQSTINPTGGILTLMTPYTLAAGTTYVLGFEQIGGNSVIGKNVQFFDAGCLESLTDFAGYLRSYNGSSWTDYTDRTPMIFPVFDVSSVSAGGGGGGLLRAGGFTGGYRRT